ncbi:IS5 family transposase [Geobacter anodireducens]|uniref:IS5 family transposase n=1 Tax=Geobacter anodireducens TaxID=1340425 RepID=A0ABR9NSH3_9BACT|nr:IS5 family transposase [Geobacter anodireducens]MBE2887214.1 IS5 family transposase [Geobacter anodireducens]
MRGFEQQSDALFVYISPESFVPKDHPLRPIRQMVDVALDDLSPVFCQMYSHTGRPSVPPEQLLKAMLLQVLYSIPSNVKLVEQIHFSILFRWFLGLGLDEPVWDHSSFSKNQERLIETDVATKFLAAILEQARGKKLLSKDHFSVDGTLIQAWASIKSFKPRDDDQEPPAGKNPTRDFRGEKLVNDTHASTTDPEAKLYRKSSTHEAKLSFAAHVLTENRNGLVMVSTVTEADGFAERDAAEKMLGSVVNGKRRITVAADKNYDTKGFVKAARTMKATPHVAQNTERNGGSAIDGRTTRHSGYAVSQKFRKRIEEVFGWLKTTGQFRQTRYRGVTKINWYFTLAVTAYNLVRMRNLGVGTA